MEIKMFCDHIKCLSHGKHVFFYPLQHLKKITKLPADILSWHEIRMKHFTVFIVDVLCAYVVKQNVSLHNILSKYNNLLNNFNHVI